MGTLSKVLAAWGESNFKRKGNECRGHSPLRVGSDGDSFTLTITDEEHGAYMDHKDNEGGSLYELAKLMGIEIEYADNGNGHSSSGLTTYRGLEDYAAAHGVGADIFRAWDWAETMQYCGQRGKEAPALVYPTKGGKRYRFIDGLKPKYISPGFRPCWYGLNFAMDMLQLIPDSALVICNGEPSTIVAQSFGIPACCTPGGERRLGDELLKQLKEVWQGEIWIVYDCDEQGRKASGILQQQLQGLGYVVYVLDIQLQEHGDLADLCRLHGIDTYQHLSTLVPLVTTGILSSSDMAKLAVAQINTAPDGENLVFPFKAFHRLGGMCRIVAAGEVVIISGISGGGKTSFMECLTEPLIQRGLRVLWDGKEWSPSKMHARRIQRLTGITTEQQKLHNHWKSEEARNKPVNLREGVRFTPEEEQQYLQASDKIARYPGRVDYMPQMPCLEDTLGLLSERLNYYRQRRETAPIVVFDYAQLWKMRTVNNAPSNLFEYALDTVKDWTLRENIISFVLSQSNKTETDLVKVADSTYLLDSSSSQYIRDDKCNLMITLNPQYEEDRNHMHNGKAQLRKREYLVANVVKNSDGREGFIRLQAWWERLMVMDKVMPTVKVDMDD